MSDSSTAFQSPPVDGTHTLDQMYDWHRVHSADVGVFMFDKGNDPNVPMTTMTWKELGQGIIRGVKIIEDRILEKVKPSSEQEPMVLGLLATSDIVTYMTFLLSHLRLSHPSAHRRSILPFAISPRNSPAGVAHLIIATGAKYVWTTDGHMKAILEQALNEGGITDTAILQMPSFSDLFPPSMPPIIVTSVVQTDTVDLDTPALILHSSGSTAFPKLQKISHRILVEWSQGFNQGDLKARGEIISTHLQPVYHAMGIILSCWAAVTGYIRCVPSPHLPFSPVTPEYLLAQVLKSKSSLLVTVPNFLEIWAKDPASVETLKTLKYILWGGAPLHPDVGRYLHNAGVRFQSVYGATETGIVTCLTDEPRAEGYEWFALLPHITPILVPEAEGIFELLFQNTARHHVTTLNTHLPEPQDDEPAYATNDLLERHPSTPGLFRVVGRKDDQIMLGTGEKTNPSPLEAIIVKNPHVAEVLMFGAGRFQNGVLVEPVSHEYSAQLGLEEYRNLIWPSVEKANEFAPAYSQIFKEMILVSSPSKPFQHTFKGNVRRAATLDDYAEEIDTLYKLVDDSAHWVDEQIQIPRGSPETGGWDAAEGLSFVREVIQHTLKNGSGYLQDEDDIFTLGCDSLQATYIRNALLYALRQTLPQSSRTSAMIPTNFVYNNPTPRTLARYVVGLSRGTADALPDNDVERGHDLEAIITKYTRDWPVHCPRSLGSRSPDGGGETILLTGSTGGLGSQLLAQLLELPTVARVYALNRRREGESVGERHAKVFEDRGNDVGVLKETEGAGRVVFVEGDTGMERLGLDVGVYGEIRDSVTTIIHNAWRVDFNLSLSSFESAIRGVRFMIDLALQSPNPEPPRLMFTSSIGVVKGSPHLPHISEGPITDTTLLNSTGYGTSKWISEHILSAAAQATVLRPIIVRVGQLCGGINGCWNVREWFPALVRASQVVGGVPARNELVSFLPLHVAATAVIELRNSPHEFAHLVHPRPIAWTLIAEHVANALSLPLIPYDEWLRRLEASATITTDEALHDNTALHLLPFYRAALDIEGGEAMGMTSCETTRTAEDAPALGVGRLSQLGEEDVQRWIGYWRRKGVLNV